MNKKIGTLSTNNILVVLLIASAFGVGYLWNKVSMLEKNTNTTVQNAPAVTQPAVPTTRETMEITKPDPVKDHWLGPKNANIVMVEYSDHECPFCKQHHTTPVKIQEENKEVAWVFRHFPLSFHPKAQKAGEATECAADQNGNDGFWKLSNAIFEAMPTLELTGLGDLAAKNGLNKALLQKCLDSDKFAQKVKDQLAEGSKAGVQATPTTVLYNMKTGATKVIEGAVPFETYKATLDAFIKG